MEWTPDQQKAIDGRQGTLLVSAAAGSGKTAVLVERVIQRICDSSSPCGIENLLIVTFTNAAAAQMKEKIAAALDRRLAETPEDRHLRRQQLMLPCANICTIDSFCIRLVRENFHALGISPDFTLLDQGETAQLQESALQTVLQARYAAPTPGFSALCTLLGNARDDSKLTDAVLSLFALSQAYAFPRSWMHSLLAPFDASVGAKESPWGQQILSYVRSFLTNAARTADQCLRMLEAEPELAGYQPTFQSDLALFAQLEAALDGPWDAICDAFAGAKFDRLGSAPRKYESFVRTLCKHARDDYKDELKKLTENGLCVREAEHAEDLASLAPAVGALVDAALAYDDAFSAAKRARNTADFSDTLHLALQLLLRETPDGTEKTALAESLSAQYEEILVDEFQDVNAAQNMIFKALSRNEENLFMVGDVKQSIYGFRRAMPEIFLHRRDALQDYDGTHFPARVTLGRNFRSRAGVTGIVNYIFEAVMSSETGGVTYDAGERLEAAAPYAPKPGPATELYLVEAPTDQALQAQAVFLADYITNAMQTGMTVKDGDGERPVQLRDFCILLRSVQRTTRAFTDVFTARGIPFLCEAGKGILTAPEVRFLLSLLKVLNDPLEDIPLTAVLLSPAFGFTPAELARMRAAQRQGPIYHCLVHAAENGDAKAAAFLEQTVRLRRLAVTVRTGELVRRLIDETGYDAIVCAMRDSEKRRANLNLLIDLANRYEHNGGRGVDGFLRYVDATVSSGRDLQCGDAASDAADAVRIMTIHKSKGLEFPICILAGCERSYNTQAQRSDLILAPGSGVGLIGGRGAVKYDTLSRIAAQLEIRRTENSEELRVLYVALTRAKEKLLVLAAGSDWSKRLAAIAAKAGTQPQIPPFTVNGFSRYSEVLLAALVRHPDAHALRMAAGLPSDWTVPCDTPLRAEIVRPELSEAEQAQTRTLPAPDPAIVAQLRDQLAYVYPYAPLHGVVAKRIASRMEGAETDTTYFASARPAFMSKEGLTPAQRGTATHRFMEFADFRAAAADPAAELRRLTDAGYFSPAQAQAVDLQAITRFFASPLAARMFRSPRVLREYGFRVGVPLAELQPELAPDCTAGERIVIEGVVDCAFLEDGALVIVDYKTDRVQTAQALTDRYRAQLAVYRRCLSEALELPVKETLIYSFRLHESVTLFAGEEGAKTAKNSENDS
ncbi:MAG: helicase-exonuclease AddAB subunit AddA [Clostridia bacterium]|nr:helicase-exonuclease AddAB subunit AddA [Clostridia bacterium]